MATAAHLEDAATTAVPAPAWRPAAAQPAAPPTPRFTTVRFPTLRVAAANPRMLLVKPRATLFMARYMKGFPTRRFGENLILHSHLPPLTSKAYARFVDHHLVRRLPGPSHAQIGLTNACPQNCEYCYNKQRSGIPMDTATIIHVVDDLRAAGVCWLGLTGGEPLLNRDIVDIAGHASPDMAVKLFTTGVGLSPRLARDLAIAGVFSVCISLDHWDAGRHNASRRYPRAFQEAVESIRILKEVPGLHVGVSSVLSRTMIQSGEVDTLLRFLGSLAVDEAWLSELKPSVEEFWSEESVISEHERRFLARLQDRYNRQARATGGMMVNYLGHFEGAENFGCNAGGKMVYVDAFGEVSPCVFLPFSFGNVRERPLGVMLAEMRERFPGEARCFINKNYGLFRTSGTAALPLDRGRTIAALRQIESGPASEFSRRLYGGSRGAWRRSGSADVPLPVDPPGAPRIPAEVPDPPPPVHAAA